MEFSSKITIVGSHSHLQGISLPRDGTKVSYIAGRFFTIWAMREALEFVTTKEEKATLFFLNCYLYIKLS